jgi:hypothetical protein
LYMGKILRRAKIFTHFRSYRFWVNFSLSLFTSLSLTFIRRRCGGLFLIDQRCFDAFREEDKAEILKVRPGLSGIGAIYFRDEEYLLHTAQGDMIRFYPPSQKTTGLPATRTADRPMDECAHACYATARCRPKLRRIRDHGFTLGPP